MNRINQLDSNLASQIAAGEVIERPASVVKELLENSVDAGADAITINIEDGGVGRIQIIDNGHGIHPDDLSLSIMPHATSKIASVDDLAIIRSLGFRGEALASIASVAEISLTSKLANGTQANKLVVKGGDIQGPFIDKGDVGTSIDVANLFYNVPVRKKFLKSSKTEGLHIDNTIKRSMLGNYEIRYNVNYQGRNVYSFSAANNLLQQEKRISRLLGKSFLEHAINLEIETNDLFLRGWICMPTLEKRQSDWQFFYLNGRVIRDRLVQHAIRQAFGESLDSNFQPAYVLYLTMNPALVDINVHPTKHEVRFQDSRYVHDFLVSAISQALQGGTREQISMARKDFNNNLQTGSLSSSKGYEIQTETTIDDFRDVVGVIHKKYAMTNTQLGMNLFDIKELYVQIVYWKLERLQLDSIKKLALPKTISVDTHVFIKIGNIIDLLRNFGLYLDVLSENTFVIRQADSLYQGIDFYELLVELSKFVGAERKKDFIHRQLSEAITSQFAFDEEKYDLQEMLKYLKKMGCHYINFRGRVIWRELTLAHIKELL